MEEQVVGRATPEGPGEAAVAVFDLSKAHQIVELEQWLAAHIGDRWMPMPLVAVSGDEGQVVACAVRMPELKFRPSALTKALD